VTSRINKIHVMYPIFTNGRRYCTSGRGFCADACSVMIPTYIQVVGYFPCPNKVQSSKIRHSSFVDTDASTHVVSFSSPPFVRRTSRLDESVAESSVLPSSVGHHLERYEINRYPQILYMYPVWHHTCDVSDVT